MARISLVDPRHASPEVQQIFEHRLKGRPANLHRAMAHQPAALLPFLSFYAAVGRSLDRRLYELVYIRVSILNRCDYCLQHHLASSKRAGLTPHDWEALKNPLASPFSEMETAVLAYAEKLTRAPREITDGDIATLKQHLSDAQIVDLHLLIGVANLTNRFTGPLGLELEMPAEKL